MVERQQRWNLTSIKAHVAAIIGLSSIFAPNETSGSSPQKHLSPEQESSQQIRLSEMPGHFGKALDTAQLLADLQADNAANKKGALVQAAEDAASSRKTSESEICQPQSRLVSILRERCPVSVKNVFEPPAEKSNKDSKLDGIITTSSQKQRGLKTPHKNNKRTKTVLNSKFERMPPLPFDELGPDSFSETQTTVGVDPQVDNLVPSEDVLNNSDGDTAATTDLGKPNHQTAVEVTSASFDLYQLPEGQTATLEDYKKQQEQLYKLLPPVELQLREAYGGITYPTIESMPEELRNYYLETVNVVASWFNISPIILQAFHFGEQMGAGFKLEDAISYAAAAGEGQITPGFWNGWGYLQDKLFVTSPAESTGYGKHVDLDGDGFINPYRLQENVAATALGLLDSNLGTEALGKMSENEQRTAILDAAVGYNSSIKVYAEAGRLPKTQEYARIILDYISNYEVLGGLEQLTEAYKLHFENSFANEFTQTEAKYVASQADVVEEFVKNGDLHWAIQTLYERQVAAAYANPEQYPFYLNKEYYQVQQAAVETVGAQLGSAAEIKAFLDWSANENNGVVNLDSIKENLSNSPQAEIKEWLEFTVHEFVGKDLTKAETAQLLQAVYKEFAVPFVSLPGQAPLSPELIQKILADLRQVIAQMPEFEKSAPELLLLRERAPLGPIFKNASGETVGITVREIFGDKPDTETTAFGEHGNKDYFAAGGGFDFKQPRDNWYGIDIKDVEPGSYVVAPLSGEVIEVVSGKAYDGPGNSILIQGTGAYEGLYLSILHLGTEYLPKVGQSLNKGDRIGVVSYEPGAGHLHVGATLKAKTFRGQHGEFYLPAPTLLLFGKDSGLSDLYWPFGQPFDRDGDVIVTEYYKNYFEIEKVLKFISVWDFDPGLREYYDSMLRQHFPDLHAQLPRVLKLK